MGAHKQAIDTTIKVIKKLKKIAMLNQKNIFNLQYRENTHYSYPGSL